MAKGAGEDGPHPVDQFVGRRVAERRVGLGLKQSDLGRAVGVTFQQIQKYENGSNRISASRLWHTAEFLGVDISYFFDGLARTMSDPVDQNATSECDYPATRQSLQIGRLAPRLSNRHQTLTLRLMKELADPDHSEA